MEFAHVRAAWIGNSVLPVGSITFAEELLNAQSGLSDNGA
jgi:hypothetical protein